MLSSFDVPVSPHDAVGDVQVVHLIFKRYPWNFDQFLYNFVPFDGVYIFLSQSWKKYQMSLPLKSAAPC